MTSTYITLRNQPLKLGRHHFAHLLSVAEGIDFQTSAKRYLGVDHGHQAKKAHQKTVDAVRSIARRNMDSAWRLIGISINVTSKNKQPSLEEFIAARDLDGWSEDEVLEMYQEEYSDTGGNSSRRVRLRERQIELLRSLERLAVINPKSEDPIHEWFDSSISHILQANQILTLNELRSKIQTNKSWFSDIPGIGYSKGLRIAAHLGTLLAQDIQPNLKVFSPGAPDQQSIQPTLNTTNPIGGLIKPSAVLIASDQEAIDAWVSERAKSELTAKIYRRESHRFVLWLRHTLNRKSFAQIATKDCDSYVSFLQNIPSKWISRVRAKPNALGWAPFRGQLDPTSIQKAVLTLTAMFEWLRSERYIETNPWLQATPLALPIKPQDPKKHTLNPDQPNNDLLSFLGLQPPCPSGMRIKFALKFMDSVNLRTSELLNVKLEDLIQISDSISIRIYGKGKKNLLIPIPEPAKLALLEYLEYRGLTIESASPNTPLIASATNPNKQIGYQSFYESLNVWQSKYQKTLKQT